MMGRCCLAECRARGDAEWSGSLGVGPPGRRSRSPAADLDRRGRQEDRSSMGDVIALPLPCAVALPDVRGEHRAMQVTWHERDNVFVVSMWRSGSCVASVHLAPAEAAALIGALADGLAGRPRA